MKTKDKIFTIFAVLIFGAITSYIAFGWSEPSGTMPTDYKIPINTTAEDQDVAEEKPVVNNLNVDKLDGYDSSDFLSAGTVAGSGLYLVVANAAKNNPSLGFPDCPTGFDAVLQDGFVQYQNDTNVIGGFYSSGYLYYYPELAVNGLDRVFQFRVPQNTQTSACNWVGYKYWDNSSSYFQIPITCVGDCSSCSDAASISLTYSVCSRDPTASTFQGGEVSAPEITSFSVERLISDIPYKGKLQIDAVIDNGGENVTAKLYSNGNLIDSETVTSSYSFLYEAAESTLYDITLEINNSTLTPDEESREVWLGALGGGMHTESDCTDLGGTVYSVESGVRMCRLTQSTWTCPTDWSGYYNWSTTTTVGTCYCGSIYCCCTGGHDWANIARESCWHTTTMSTTAYYNATVVERGCY